MKVRVIRPFRDKRNGKVYAVGDVINVTKERLTEIERVSKRLVKKEK